MPDIETQLREYFGAGVERITAEDIAAGRHVFERHVQSSHRARRPVWAAAGAFAATAVTLGAALGAGLLLRSDGTTPSGPGGVEPIAETPPVGGAFLALATALIIGLAAALVVRSTRPLRRKEETMATTLETATQETAERDSRRNRGLIVTVVILAIALIALAGWVVYDQTAQAETAAPAAVEELMDEYIAAWNTGDGDAFYTLTTEDFAHFNTLEPLGVGPYGREMMRDRIESATVLGMTIEPIGDLIVTGDGPYYVSTVDRVTTGDGTELGGISTFVVVDTSDGLKVAQHTYLGEA